MASTPIIRNRSSGRDSRPIDRPPITVPAGIAAISSPTVSGPPPSVRAYGAARPSGTMANPASQPNRTSVRAAGRRKMRRHIPGERLQQGRPAVSPLHGPGRTQPAISRGRQAERQCVQRQRAVGAEGRHQDPAHQEPGGLAGLEGDVPHGGAQREPLAGEDLREQGGAGRRERGPEQHGAQQQRAGARQRHPGQCHELHQPAADQVQGDHDLAPRERVRQARTAAGRR